MSTIPECLFVLIDVPPTHPSYTPVIETTLALINIHLISGGENQLVVFDTCGSKPFAPFKPSYLASQSSHRSIGPIPWTVSTFKPLRFNRPSSTTISDPR